MRERISALMDGELEDRDAGSTIQAMARDEAAREAWRTYHLIGDAMRESGLLSHGFAARLEARLAEEPTVLAPAAARVEPRRWVALPVAASLAAVALVGWLAFAPPQQGRPDAPALARAPAAEAPATARAVPLPSAASDYLLAHQGFSPRVSFQGMAPYVRTVSDEAQGAKR